MYKEIDIKMYELNRHMKELAQIEDILTRSGITPATPNRVGLKEFLFAQLDNITKTTCDIKSHLMGQYITHYCKE